MQTLITAFALSLLFFQSSGQGKKTDRDVDELNGPVRFVRVEIEYRDQSGAPKTERSLEKIVAYDVSGRATEAIRGLGADCISSRHVYGYDAEGNRTIAVYSGNALAAGGKSDPSQPPASPLIYKQVFTIDGAGRRSEIDEYDNAGKLSGKSYYKYDDQGRLNEIIQENGSTRSRCEFKYNEQGLASEKTCQSSNFRVRDRSQYAYEYDARGNWIKRVAKNSGIQPNGLLGESIQIHYRDIKYYASKGDQAQLEEVGDRFDATKLAPCQVPKIIRKAGGVFQGSATRRVEPRYPRDAIAARISGSVVVEVTADEQGRVISARAISGPVELRGASEEAARQWVFHPTKLEGTPVKVIGTITFNFNL